MAACQVIVKLEDPGGAAGQALAHVWVYWKEGDATTVLRTNADGLLQALAGGESPTRPWSYSAPFTSAPGAKIKIPYSTGNKPTPQARLDEHVDAFVDKEVPKGEQQQGPASVQIAPNQLNTLKATALVTAVVTLPPARVVSFEDPDGPACTVAADGIGLERSLEETLLAAGDPQALVWRREMRALEVAFRSEQRPPARYDRTAFSVEQSAVIGQWFARLA